MNLRKINKKRIKLLLVYPPVTKEERYGSNLGIFGGKQIPLGLYYLAAYIREHGYEVYAIDAEARRFSIKDILAIVKNERYTVLGVSATTVAFHRALGLAEAAKKYLADITTIIGGPHVSCDPRGPMQFSAFDYAIPHEGERTLLELLRGLEQGGETKNIRGVVHRCGGEIIVNPPRGYISDLDSLPFPAYDMIPDITIYNPPPFNYRQRPVANIITSRGCPNECTFCERSTFGRKVRMRSAENIVAEIELLLTRYGVREIAFVDDTFTLKSKRIYEIFEKSRLQGLRFSWTCMSRINTVNEKLLKYMRDNGCWYIAFGIESGDQKILKEIRKKINLHDVKNVVNICNNLGIVTKGFFMVGHPKESIDTIDKTIEFAKSLELNHIVVTINTPMPGSYQYKHAAEYGHLYNDISSKFNYWNPVFVPFGLSQDDILAKHREFLKKFYLRPYMFRRAIKVLLENPHNTVYQCWNVINDFFRYLILNSR